MRQISKFVDDGGNVHENIQDAQRGDALYAIDQLIEKTVPYTSHKSEVRKFIHDNFDQLLELMVAASK